MIRYNREGDLLFSASKDATPTVWFTHNGERLGTYNGHNGTIWCLSVNCKRATCPPLKKNWRAHDGRAVLTLCTHDDDRRELACTSSATTTRLLTGSADTNAKMWDVETGKELFNLPHKVSARVQQSAGC